MKFKRIKHKNMLNLFGSKSKKIESIKIVMIGDGGVGKTSILTRLFEDDPIDQDKWTASPSTCGIDMRILTSQNCRMRFYDTAGQERYDSITRQYFRDADICLFIFDIGRTDTYRNIFNKWMKYVDEINPDYPVTKILVANKIDLLKTETDFLKLNDPKFFAIENNMTFHTTSIFNHDTILELRQIIYRQMTKIVEERHNKTLMQSVFGDVLLRPDPEIILTERDRSILNSYPCCSGANFGTNS